MTDTAETRWEVHNEAGRRLFTQGDHAAAEQEFVAAIREATLLGADNVRLASSLSGLGQIKYRQKDLEQAEALFRRALAIRERVLGADHFSLVQAVNNLATLHYSRGELDQAAKYFTRALEICDKNLGEKHPDVAVTLNNLARLHFRRNDYVAAAPLLMRLLAIKQESVGAHHPEVAVILTSLAKVRLAEGQHEDAEQLARRALLIREEIHQSGDPAIATSLEMLAEVMAARGLLEDEQRLRKRAEEIRAGAPSRAPSPASGTTAASAVVPPAPSQSSRVELTSASLSAPVESTTPQAGSQSPLASDAGGNGGGGDAERNGDGSSRRAPALQVTGSQRIVPSDSPPAPRAAPAAPAPPAPPAARTTRSASLPWIEPPTSPALRRPNARPITAPRPVPPKAMEPRSAPPTGSAPRPRADDAPPTPSARGATPARGAASPRPPVPAPPSPRQSSAVSGPVSDGRHRPRRDVLLESPPRPRGRSRLGFAVGALLLLGCGAGAWVYLTNGGAQEHFTSSAGAALDQTAEPDAPRSSRTTNAGGENGDPRRASGALTASPDPAYGGAPPLREAPPARAYGDDPATPRGQPARAAGQAEARDVAAGGMVTTPLAPTPDLSRINVDRITTAIGEHAKARADSLGRKTITVKPPDFDKPRP